MLKAELLEIISNGENSGIEFKRDDIRSEQLAKEIVAMVNFQGGKIILGVEDDGSISGIQRENLEEWVMNVVRDKVHPVILPFFEKIRIKDDLFVAVLSFPPGISKPYVLRNAGREDIYLRIGSTSQIATREQQMRLFEIGGMLHTELLPVHRSEFKNMDAVRLENYLTDILSDPDVPKNREEWIDRLLGLGFLNKHDEMIYSTIAGLVLFGKSPGNFLKQSGLRLFVFEGKEKDYRAILDEKIDAPLVGRFDMSSNIKMIIDDGLIEKIMMILKPHITQEADSVNEQLRRDIKWHYPIEAIREVILNAFAHRDWTRNVDVEVGVYSDRLEIISPGALVNSMTVEKMKSGQRNYRNPLIMEVLRDYGYVDYRGMGIRTKVVPLMKKFNGTEPVFEANEDYLKTTFYRR